ncbi:putative polymerase with PALM domain, HD hydrolase domain and Zn ribbon [Herbaspirillum sp. CF444]|uniref:DUF342 domain-containing protein n=1 Tax=Herbaspirillum sp. CF444 TaxID=1144319 RepID=UPI0002722DE4|nr:FapA family protein [Herbaspirillum sp. CF444]EJL83782.1 putative polymerase with PALM domain, HD hydrolase domain and Zn ribbon [Herbaspirillum sp. CF444]
MEQTSPQSLSFNFDRVSGELAAAFTPVEGVQVPNLVILKQALTDGGFTKLYIDEAMLGDFAAKAATAKEAFSQKIGERRDGEFLIEISEDLMGAYLTLVPPQGGRARAVEVVNEIRARGITHGIMHEKLRGALSAGQCSQLLIAKGDEPIEGQQARFESLLEEKEEELSEVDEDAVVSYADLGHLLLINVGDPLMRRIPTVAGVNGVNIKGQPVLAKPVTEIDFNKDCIGTEVKEDNPDLLVAAIAGQPSLITNGVKINPIVEIEDVDLSTGNVTFSGTVKIKGDVKTGMRLHVSGDVFVNGTVEAAEIIAGGNVFVKGGIIGHSETQPGVSASIAARIKAEGSVQALFAESALIEARQDIMIAGNARQCEMMAGNEILVGKTNPKLGQIIGGRAQATMMVKAVAFGSPSAATTKIQVGLDPYLEEKLRAKEQEFQKKLDELDRTIKQLAHYKQNPEKAKNGVGEETEQKRKMLAQEVKDLIAEQAEMKEDLVAAESARIVAVKTVYEGVEMRIARQVWQVLSDLGGGTAQLQGGKISFGGK